MVRNGKCPYFADIRGHFCTKMNTLNENTYRRRWAGNVTRIYKTAKAKPLYERQTDQLVRHTVLKPAL